MFTKVLNALFLVIISILAVSVHTSIIGCDPFPSLLSSYGHQFFAKDFRATCPDSTILWTTKSEGLEVVAAIENCGSASNNSTSSVSVYFSASAESLRENQYNIDASSDYQYYFEYSIKWTENDTFCVVDLTGSSNESEIIPLTMIDQNGLTNSPTEDLSMFATDQWYTRYFIFNSTTASTLRFGFLCATNASGPSNTLQKAYVDNIRFRQLGTGTERVLYSHRQNCTSCPDFAPPVYDMYCDEGMRTWTIDGPANVTTVDWDQYVVVNGDLYADNFVLFFRYAGLLNVTGCIYPSTPGGFVNFTEQIYADYTTYYDIFIGSNCSISHWSFPKSLNFTKYNRDGDTVVTIVKYNRGGCAQDPSCSDYLRDHWYDDGGLIAAVVIVPVVAATGLIVGLVLGIKNCRAKRREKTKLESELSNVKSEP